MPHIDLSQCPIIDGHCHPWRTEEVTARDAASFETRFTLTGACWVLGTDEDPRATWTYGDLVDMAAESVQVLALRRWLAEHLGCEPTREAVAEARKQALQNDPRGYINGLNRSVGLAGLICDEGTPGYIPLDEFEQIVDIPVHHVFRLEPWIGELKSGGFAELTAKLFERVERKAKDPRTVAFKSFIQFYTGGDVKDPSEAEAAASYKVWQAAGFAQTAELAKPLWDFILQRVMDVAKKNGLAVHFHVGAEGNDPVIGRPFDFYPFIKQHDAQPIVLIHSGYPWVMETSYLAATFPEVFLDLSEITLWAPGQVDWVLEMLLGSVPTNKILHGSDMCVEPEQAWYGAKVIRPALTRVLEKYVDRDLLTDGEAQRVGENVLAGNAARLHEIA